MILVLGVPTFMICDFYRNTTSINPNHEVFGISLLKLVYESRDEVIV